MRVSERHIKQADALANTNKIVSRQKFFSQLMLLTVIDYRLREIK
jgi:hypothetical protein